ncbi:MAG: hypothetical protein GY854_07815 [Deltaproteobacteria bacterium]|nr:hypothetical protein [Deltaproteobacteria bacterium]
MPLPSLTESGDLPVGVHGATMAEIVERFGSSSDRRKLLVLRLRRVYDVAKQTGHLVHFVVFGSFVTSKNEPDDVDVFMIMDDAFEYRRLGRSRLLFEHGAGQGHFGCSVFWVRRMAAIGGEQAAMEDWQIKRDGTERGIVKITGE